MKILTNNATPLFLPSSGIGPATGDAKAAPQIHSFDVYYTAPLLVGFHVVGSKAPDKIGGFFAELVLNNPN